MSAALRLLGLIGLLLAMSGCLGTTEEIFAADQAATVPGVEGNYVQKESNTQDVVRVERIAGSPDYAYFDPKQPDKDRGRMRAVSVGGDIYVLQMRDDSWPADQYWQLLVKIERENNSVKRVVVVFPDDDAVTALAAQSGVELAAPGAGDAFAPKMLKGSRAAIAAFLRKLPTLPLREIGSYVKS